MDTNQALAILHEYTGRLALPRKEHDILLQALQVLVNALAPAPAAPAKVEEPKKAE